MYYDAIGCTNVDGDCRINKFFFVNLSVKKVLFGEMPTSTDRNGREYFPRNRIQAERCLFCESYAATGA